WRRLGKRCDLLAELGDAPDGSPVGAVSGDVLRPAQLPILEHPRDDALIKRSEHLPRLSADLVAQRRRLLAGCSARRILAEAQQLKIVVRPGKLHVGGG